MIKNIFEYAVRNKLRFQSVRGELTTEQLWDVPLRSRAGDGGFNLDAVAKATNKTLKDATEESFVDTNKTAAHVRLEVALDVVRAVIDAKLADEEAAANRAANKHKKEMLLKALAEKQEGKLSAMSEKDLQRQIDSLEG